MLITAQDSSSYANCFIPRRYTNSEKFDIKMAKLEEKMLQETLKPFKPSGHAFVCFDSVKSASLCMSKFRIGPISYLKLMFLQLRDKIKNCFNPHYRNRSRIQSTFIKFEDLDARSQVEIMEESVLIMNIASEPIDILWKNMGGTRGVYLFRRIFLYLLGLVIIVFVSTPTAILSTI